MRRSGHAFRTAPKRRGREAKKENVPLQVSHVRLLVERSLGQAERVDNVVHPLLARLEGLLGLLSRTNRRRRQRVVESARPNSYENVPDMPRRLGASWARQRDSRVGTDVDLTLLDGDHGAVRLVDDVIDQLELRCVACVGTQIRQSGERSANGVRGQRGAAGGATWRLPSRSLLTASRPSWRPDSCTGA